MARRKDGGRLIRRKDTREDIVRENIIRKDIVREDIVSVRMKLNNRNF